MRHSHESSYLPSPKPLICVAHRAEAQAFFTHWAFEKKASQSGEFWESPQAFLLVTGEGEIPALLGAASLLGEISLNVNIVVNCGVALGIAPKMEIGDVLEVRHVFGKGDLHYRFHSFPTVATQSTMDLITVAHRLQEPEKALSLRTIASLVDREAWGIACAAHKFHKPLSVFKVISDRLDQQMGQCQIIRSSAPQFSQNLFDFYETQRLHQNLKDPTEKESEWQNWLTQLKSNSYLHWTFTQTCEAENLLRKIDASDFATELAEKIESIRQTKVRPKQRTQALLNFLRQKVNPLRTHAPSDEAQKETQR